MKLLTALDKWKNSLKERLSDREAESQLKALRSDHPELGLLQLHDEVNEDLVSAINDKINAGIPIQYITGFAFFYDRLLAVNQHTLIPRSETEELIYSICRDYKNRIALRVLDIGTGSGCIPIILKDQFPSFQITAIDVSEDALLVARSNAVRYNGEIAFIKVDFLMEEDRNKLQTYDIIVSNPPYIDISEKEKMDVPVIEHEPHIALFTSNGNPLQFYESILDFSKTHLAEGGSIYLELNEFHAKATQDLFSPFYEVEIIMDLQGKPRILKCTQLAA